MIFYKQPLLIIFLLFSSDDLSVFSVISPPLCLRLTDYADTDYGPNADGVTDYADTDYGPNGDGVTDYDDGDDDDDDDDWDDDDWDDDDSDDWDD